MMKHIHHLRTQPDHVKRNVALGTSLAITGIIVLFWLMSFAVTSPTQDASNTATAIDSITVTGAQDK